MLQMSGFVEEQLKQAVTALVQGDSRLGEQVARGDQKVNAMEVAIDDDCSRILATRSPAASDLRLIVAVICRPKLCALRKHPVTERRPDGAGDAG